MAQCHHTATVWQHTGSAAVLSCQLQVQPAGMSSAVTAQHSVDATAATAAAIAAAAATAAVSDPCRICLSTNAQLLDAGGLVWPLAALGLLHTRHGTARHGTGACNQGIATVRLG